MNLRKSMLVCFHSSTFFLLCKAFSVTAKHSLSRKYFDFWRVERCCCFCSSSKKKCPTDPQHSIGIQMPRTSTCFSPIYVHFNQPFDRVVYSRTRAAKSVDGCSSSFAGVSYSFSKPCSRTMTLSQSITVGILCAMLTTVLD